MKAKKIIAILLMIALSVSVYGCNAIKDLVSDEEEPDIEIVRSDEDQEESEEETGSNIRDTILYFQNEMGYLVPVKKQIPWETGIAKAALRNMIDTPAIRDDMSTIGLMPLIPSGTEISGMAIDEESGLCKVNFNKSFTETVDKVHEENLVKGVVYTLTEFPSISKVQILIDGKEMANLQHGTEISSAINREDINLLEANGEGNNDVMVYYKAVSSSGYEHYVPVTVQTNKENNVNTVLSQLFNGKVNVAGLYTEIPEGVSLGNVEVKDGIAYIDITTNNEEVIAQQVTFDRMSRNIGLTISQFNDILGLELSINGKTLQEAGIEGESSNTIPVFANEY
ncbi:GerMN domain-containing protein [Dethiothermospora halolimnae]|uniref:GerMN domain-containing protein n=1 Tax=Dethiothermospora halolimnae TaxID=3114390 RepID=UPI003CCBE056